MRHKKLHMIMIVLLMSAVFLMLAPVNSAAESGDDVRASQVSSDATIDVHNVIVESGPNDVVFSVPVYMQNDVEIAASSINLFYDSDDIRIDSLSKQGVSWEHIMVDQSRVTPDSNLAVIAWVKFAEPIGVLPGDSLFGTLWFTLDANAPEQVINIDSGYVPPAGKFILTNKQGFSIVPDYVPGEITIVAAGSELTLSNDSLYFEGSTSNPPSQAIEILNTGQGSMNWTAETEADWIDFDPLNGTAPSILNVSVDLSLLAGGSTYVDSIKIDAGDADNSPQYIKVVFKVGNFAPEITTIPATLAVADNLYTHDVDAEGFPAPEYELVTAPAGMAIDQATGVITWTPPPVLTDYDVEVRAFNVAGEDTQNFTITVKGYAPTITTEPPLDATLGSTYTYNVDATGVPDPWFTFSKAPAGMTIDSATGLVTWLPNNVGPVITEVGDYDVKVVAKNPDMTIQNFTVTVKGVPARIVSTAPIDPVDTGEVYVYDLNAVGKPLPEFALLEAPAGMTINAENGLITWTPTEYGVYNVIAEARNIVEAPDVAAVDTEEFTVVVELPTGVDDGSGAVIPTRVELGNNYPNPFNPNTMIEYALPENAYVTLTVYDILGRKVTTLVEGSKSAGYYSTSWNGTDSRGNVVASGVYFYRLKAGNHIETKRMVLQK